MKQLTRVPRWLWLSLAVLIVIRAGLPIALERAIPWFAKHEIGADVEIENIDLGLFSGKFVIQGLRVASPPNSVDSETPALPKMPQASATPVAARVPTPESEAADTAQVEPDQALLSLTRLQLEIDWLELFGAHVSLPLIRLDGLTLRLHQNRDGSFALPAPPPPEGDGELEPSASLDPSEGEPAPDTPAAHGALEDETSKEVATREVTSEVPDEASGWQFSVWRFELNKPDLAVHSERVGGEAANLTLTRFAVDALTSGPAGFGLGDIAIEGPEVFVERDWLFDTGVGGGGKAPREGETRPPSLQIARLAMSSGHFLIHSPDGPIESAIRIEVLRFDTARGGDLPHRGCARRGRRQPQPEGPARNLTAFLRGRARLARAARSPLSSTDHARDRTLAGLLRRRGAPRRELPLAGARRVGAARRDSLLGPRIPPSRDGRTCARSEANVDSGTRGDLPTRSRAAATSGHRISRDFESESRLHQSTRGPRRSARNLHRPAAARRDRCGRARI